MQNWAIWVSNIVADCIFHQQTPIWARLHLKAMYIEKLATTNYQNSKGVIYFTQKHDKDTLQFQGNPNMTQFKSEV